MTYILRVRCGRCGGSMYKIDTQAHVQYSHTVRDVEICTYRCEDCHKTATIEVDAE